MLTVTPCLYLGIANSNDYFTGCVTWRRKTPGYVQRIFELGNSCLRSLRDTLKPQPNQASKSRRGWTPNRRQRYALDARISEKEKRKANTIYECSIQ